MSEHRTHILKTWPEFYNAVASGNKKFELRYNDRDYRAGDVLVLREWDKDSGDYSGRWYEARVTYVLPWHDFTAALIGGWCVMSIKGVRAGGDYDTQYVLHAKAGAE